MPKSKLVQEQQNHSNEREKGDVLSSEEQPSFVVCASSTNMMQTLNDKCVKNALTCSEGRDQDDNNSSVTGKADSSEFSVQYPSNNLKHDLVCDDIPLMIFEKGKVQNHTINFSFNFIKVNFEIIRLILSYMCISGVLKFNEEALKQNHSSQYQEGESVMA